MSTQTIDLTNGALEYTYPLTITDRNGKDIHADTIALSLGTTTTPGTWQAPDTDVASADKASRTVQLLVGSGLVPAPGTYWLWSKISDSPEIAPRCHQRIIIA